MINYLGILDIKRSLLTTDQVVGGGQKHLAEFSLKGSLPNFC